MLSNCKKTSIKWVVMALSMTLLAGCSSISSLINPTNSSKNQTSSITGIQSNTNPNSNSSLSSTTTDLSSIIYKNTQYRFNFTLPKSWQGFSIVAGNWMSNDIASGKGTETGPMLSIRHPQWTTKNPRQDIPIFIFTLDQWNLLQKEKFHIGATPIPPRELGRNNIYVFALPARYNYAFPTGYKEVEEILNNHPLQPTQIAQSSDSKTAMLLNMMELAKQGRVINCDFATKITTIDTVIKAWGQANKIDYVAVAKGTYATYTNHSVVFGFNKGEQIFEIRSFSTQLKSLSLAKVKEVFGIPAYDAKSNNQEIIGYTAGRDFKMEMVFSAPTKDKPNPVVDHYNVLYPSGTVNSMAGDPERQW
ncbi:YjgB family protein [Desnuesiella massiliensis]|uniref:YjgB family protein n=1 Tax=Desnuesiella massiliensis TaxID=1650662 RepID=UPI0006E2D354|nr:YjgB family protein [Desnuesiella massiliensis]